MNNIYAYKQIGTHIFYQTNFTGSRNIMDRYMKKAARARAGIIKKRYEKAEHGRYYYLIKGILISIIISVPLFFIIALAVHITDFPEEYMPPALLTSVLAGIITASFYSTAAAKSSGWFNGTLVGFIYMLILVIIRWFAEGGISFNKDIFTMLLAGLLIGSICGMAGLNLSEYIRRMRGKRSRS